MGQRIETSVIGADQYWEVKINGVTQARGELATLRAIYGHVVDQLDQALALNPHLEVQP